MKLPWCKKYSVCSECKVHFEPAASSEDFANLCPTHRKPAVEQLKRTRAVVAWASKNWERLEPQMLEDTRQQTVKNAAFSAAMQVEMGSLAAQQQGLSRGLGSGLAGLGLGRPST